MLPYWIMFQMSAIPERYVFKNHSDLLYSLDVLIAEKGNILWMVRA